MRVMKIGVILASLVVAVFLGIQLVNFFKNNSELSSKLGSAKAEASQLSLDNAQLQADLKYFAEPENLAKELKAKFDYKKPGERLIKIQ